MTGTHLSSVKEAFRGIEHLPFCSGKIDRDVLSKQHNVGKLFYQVGDHQAAPTVEQLKLLAEACLPATFGMNKEDILDESYRKAGKMDNTEFSVLLNLKDLGILDDVAENLLRGRREASGIVAELYKLNVYGPGDFFKPHVDTPRAESMFGTLVLVLFTEHEGGALVLRQSDHEWAFDSAKLFKGVESGENDTSSIVYTAFYSDIEHEVQLVTSGYRVTLTYNLYYRDKPSVPSQSLISDYPGVSALRESLSALLQDPNFLPEGGLLGFGLSHRYPVNSNTDLNSFHGRLRGPDLLVRDLCRELRIKVALKALYRNDRGAGFCLSDNIITDIGEEVDGDDSIMTYLVNDRNAKYCRDCDLLDDDYDSDSDMDMDFTTVVWVKNPDEGNVVESHYVAYGNEAWMGHLYGEVCLVATVARAADRVTT